MSQVEDKDKENRIYKRCFWVDKAGENDVFEQQARCEHIFGCGK